MSKICILLLFAFVSFSGIHVFSQNLPSGSKWTGYDDKKSNGDSTNNFVVGKETIEGKEYQVAAMKGVVTKKYDYGFIGFGVELEQPDIERISKANKVKFKVLADGKSYKFRIMVTDVRDFDFHGKVIATKKGTIADVEVPLSTLAQEGWGKYVSFDKKKISGISFQTFGQPLDNVDIKVFDFRFE